MSFRLLPDAATDLDDIWLYVVTGSGSVERANRLIDTITERFWLLATYPQLGRRAISTCALDYAAFPLASSSSSTASMAMRLLFCA